MRDQLVHAGLTLLIVGTCLWAYVVIRLRMDRKRREKR